MIICRPIAFLGSIMPLHGTSTSHTAIAHAKRVLFVCFYFDNQLQVECIFNSNWKQVTTNKHHTTTFSSRNFFFFLFCLWCRACWCWCDILFVNPAAVRVSLTTTIMIRTQQGALPHCDYSRPILLIRVSLSLILDNTKNEVCDAQAWQDGNSST